MSRDRWAAIWPPIAAATSIASLLVSAIMAYVTWRNDEAERLDIVDRRLNAQAGEIRRLQLRLSKLDADEPPDARRPWWRSGRNQKNAE